MNAPSLPVNGTSTRPYLIRALHDWCNDNGFTPYVTVFVDETVQVPLEYVKNNEIVLNISFEATTGLKLGNDLVEFKARFGGTPRAISVPMDRVIAIYARENGQGMAFPMPNDAGLGVPSAKKNSTPSLRLAGGDATLTGAAKEKSEPEDPLPEGPAPTAGRPALKRVK
jgi:stringent starvation protein B